MNKSDDNHAPNSESRLSQQVGVKAARKLKAQRQKTAGIWFGLGMMGLIGWSVAVPTLLGAMLGLWIDHEFPSDNSWTLALLIGGLSIGCLNAWHWVMKEDKAIHQERDNGDE
jgi:ATP synthase protein I